MNTHRPTHPASKFARSFLAACAAAGLALGASAAEPLYQWNFNATDGANTGTGSGGTLTANVGGGTTGAFTGAGVSGLGGDGSFQSSNANDNWFGTDLGNAAAVSNLNLSSLGAQFTLTLWVKRSGGNNADILNIGSTATPDSSSNPGITIGLYGTWDNGVRVGVNGYSSGTGDIWSAGTDNDWVFLAFAYDSTAGVWWAPDMNTLYGQHRNGVVVSGDMVTAASVVTGVPVRIGDWGTAPGAVSFSATATAFVANNAAGTAGFSGNLDDIRIYSGLLTLAEIEAVRVSALPIPEPASAALLVGGFGLLAALGRRPSRRR
jgi:hypothetical protein